VLVQLSRVDGKQKGVLYKVYSDTAAAARVIPAILSLMKLHTGHVEVTRNYLAVLNCTSILAAHSQVMVEARGIGVLLRALKLHMYNPIVCMNACYFLRDLSWLGEHYPAIVAADEIALLIGIMMHPALMGHQVQSIGVLVNIALSTFASSLLICNAGGVQAVINTIKAQIHAKVNNNGCLLLTCLASSKEGCTFVFSEGGVSAVLVSMAKYRDDVSNQQHGCRVLKFLLMHEENTFAMIVEGDLLAAVQIHAIYTNTTSNALGFLNQLSLQQHDHSEMVAVGGIPLLIAVTVQHPGVVGIHDAACTLLISIARTDQVNQQACKDGGVLAVLSSAITQEGFGDEFKESTRQIITWLPGYFPQQCR